MTVSKICFLFCFNKFNVSLDMLSSVDFEIETKSPSVIREAKWKESTVTLHPVEKEHSQQLL